MSKSRNKIFSNQNDIGDVLPVDICNFPNVITDIIASYTWKSPLQKPSLFSNVDYTFEKILYLIEHAGPVEDFEVLMMNYIQKNLINVVTKSFILNGFEGTLATHLISRLDVIEGLGECFINLIKLHAPNHVNEVQRQMKATLSEKKVATTTLNSEFLKVIKPVLVAIKQDDENKTKKAIHDFHSFVHRLKLSCLNTRGYLTNNQFHFYLMHFIYLAFDTLSKEGHLFPPLNDQDVGGSYGERATRFSIEIIGFLQSNLPNCLKHVLESRLYYVLNYKKCIARAIELNGTSNRYVLGINAYYDDYGLRLCAGPLCGHGKPGDTFKDFLNSISLACEKIANPQLLKLPSLSCVMQ